jgi:RNA polymerase sigma factor (sigma-70 family)
MPDLREELSRAELEAAERGFGALLRRKRFSPAFIERHAADLLATARLEYSRHLSGGGEVRNPAGWIIHCAWRRTQNLLEQEGKSPRVLSIEGGGAFANESATPEDEVLSADRYRQLQAALDELPREERKVIALTYFEGMSVREVGRALKWDKCKADRRHRAALERLQELLGVSDIDSLQVEIGIAAWASLAAKDAAGSRLGAGLGATSDTLVHSIASAFARGQDFARRLFASGAAEPGVAPAAGGAARAAGVCGAAAVACVASGIVGPGVGGVDVIAEQARQKPAAERPAAEAKPTNTVTAPAEATVPATSAAEAEASAQDAQSSKQKASKRKAKKRSQRASTSGSTSTTAAPSQVAEEFDPFAGGSETSSGGSTASSGGATSSQSGGSGSGSSPAPPPASGKQVQSEFGF